MSFAAPPPLGTGRNGCDLDHRLSSFLDGLFRRDPRARLLFDHAELRTFRALDAGPCCPRGWRVAGVGRDSRRPRAPRLRGEAESKGPPCVVQFGKYPSLTYCLALRRDRPNSRDANRTSIQTRTQTWSCRISAGNRCTPCPRIVEHRPSLTRNRQRCKGQTTSPSSIQPWPSEPPACGQRSVRAMTLRPLRFCAWPLSLSVPRKGEPNSIGPYPYPGLPTQPWIGSWRGHTPKTFSGLTLPVRPVPQYAFVRISK